MQGKRYSVVAMILHWLIAIAVIVNWRVAEAADHASEAESREIMGTHMSIGVTILVLILLRFAWRLMYPPPPIAAHVSGWERVLARSVHTAFYVLLIAMPLAGWVAMSSFGFGVNIYGLFELPTLPIPQSRDLGSAIFDAHAAAGAVLLVLVVLHVLGTLKHTLVDKDGNIFRMLPFGTPRA